MRIWSVRYPNSTIHKLGQINAGSGTTPTLIGPLTGHARAAAPAYVAITDNADPMDVVVYRAGDRLFRGHRRVLCIWYWTALDYRTGKVVFQQVAGHGGLYNNHYVGIALGRDLRTHTTTPYLGGVGGIVALRDR